MTRARALPRGGDISPIRSQMDETERQALDDRIALAGVLQELTVAALDLFDPRRSVDDFLQTLAARLGCRVALCVADDGGGLALLGSAGLARTSLGLPLPAACHPLDAHGLAWPYPEVAPAHLTRWVVGPGVDGSSSAAPLWWLFLYFEREPRLPRQYRGMLERLSRHLDVAFGHRLLYEDLERRVADRTRELAVANQGLTESLESLRQTQEQLVQAGKLAAVGQLAAGLAHEINNPLTVILGFAQGLESRASTGDPQYFPIVSIVRESVRCKALIHELLTFSRIAKRTVEDVEPNAILRGVCRLLEPRAQSQGTRMMLDLADDLPVIKANATQLQQVVVNLGNNALDALGEAGEVELKSRRSGSGIVFAVRDSGPGMPDEIQSRMFEPFFTTKEVGRGTGLGLSLAFEIVRQHGGRIEVESSPGNGTTMTVSLPGDPPVDLDIDAAGCAVTGGGQGVWP